MTRKRIPADDKTMDEITKQLLAAKAKQEAFFKRYGFDLGIGLWDVHNLLAKLKTKAWDKFHDLNF
jgi:hypothetical protein